MVGAREIDQLPSPVVLTMRDAGSYAQRLPDQTISRPASKL
jgi:hypothetical protein